MIRQDDRDPGWAMAGHRHTITRLVAPPVQPFAQAHRWLPPEMLGDVMGTVAVRDLAVGAPLTWGDLQRPTER